MRTSVLITAALGLVLSAVSSLAQRLECQMIRLKSGASYVLHLADGFHADIAVEGLKRVRFMAKSPDGRIFVTDMFSRADNRRGTIYILDGFDAGAGRFTRVTPYLQHLRNPNNLAFYTDPSGQAWIYIPLTDRLVRYRYKPGDMAPEGEPEVLAHYPDYGLDYKYGGWHLTRTVAFGKEKGRDTLYVSVGSSCNACEEKEAVRASLTAMDPDGKNQRQVAKGLRNAVGLLFADGVLYGSNMGADHLGDAAPDDTFYALDTSHDIQDYGWPRCYVKGGKVVPDPKFLASTSSDCKRVPAVYTSFAAHSAALGVEHFGAGEGHLAGSFLVALHGAGHPRIGTGYRVVRFTESDRRPQDFITGFLEGTKVHGRPCGLLKLGPDAFLLTDDLSGVIFYIHRS